jgi:hypothetical protein
MASLKTLNSGRTSENTIRPPPGCLLDWTWTASELEALLRALGFGVCPNPLGLVKILIGGKIFLIPKAFAIDSSVIAAPGTACIEFALPKVRKGGYLMLDNSNDVNIVNCLGALKPYDRTAFHGIGPGGHL